MGYATKLDIETSERKTIDLICIMDDKLSEKVDALGEGMYNRIQSVEASLTALHDTLSRMMLDFVDNQNKLHFEILELVKVVSNHEGRISTLESQKRED